MRATTTVASGPVPRQDRVRGHEGQLVVGAGTVEVVDVGPTSRASPGRPVPGEVVEPSGSGEAEAAGWGGGGQLQGSDLADDVERLALGRGHDDVVTLAE